MLLKFGGGQPNSSLISWHSQHFPRYTARHGSRRMSFGVSAFYPIVGGQGSCSLVLIENPLNSLWTDQRTNRAPGTHSVG